jgi:hypothetical protein
MAKLQNFKRILAQDYEEEYRLLIEKLSFSVNSFAEDVLRTLNGNLNTDNTLEKLKTMDVEVFSSGSPKTSLQFQNPSSVYKLEGIRVIRVENLSNTGTYPTTAPFVSFSENAGIVTVNNITGLQAGYKWRLKIKLEYS